MSECVKYKYIIINNPDSGAKISAMYTRLESAIEAMRYNDTPKILCVVIGSMDEGSEEIL